MNQYDCIVVGGGIAGITTAEILQRSHLRVLLIEKDNKLGSKASSQMHGWFHTGALYAALPGKLFFKNLVGNLDDLLEYYSTFEDMNLEVPRYGLTSSKPQGWFSNNLNLYAYAHPNDKSVPFYMNIPWRIAIANAYRRLEGFNKYDFRYDISSQAWTSKKVSTKSSIYDYELPYNLGRIQKTFITKDRTMNAYSIMKDLLRSFIGNGGTIKTEEKVLETNEGQVITDKASYTTYYIINATADKNSRVVSKVVESPLAVVVPALSRSNFVKMTPVIPETFNHIFHSCGDLDYSVLGNAIYVNPKDARGKETIDRKIKEKIDYIFGPSKKRRVKIYYGTKTEYVNNSSSLRNYQYHIFKDGNILDVLPGKFTLSFGMAITLCRTLGIDPICRTRTPDIDVSGLLEKSQHYRIASELHRTLQEI